MIAVLNIIKSSFKMAFLMSEHESSGIKTYSEITLKNIVIESGDIAEL